MNRVENEADMKTEKSGLVSRLVEDGLFHKVGEDLGSEKSHLVFPIHSWEEALMCCCSDEWGNYTLEQRNLLTMYLHDHARNRYQSWNDIVLAVKDALAL